MFYFLLADWYGKEFIHLSVSHMLEEFMKNKKKSF